MLKEALVETAKELIPSIKRDKKKEWMKKEILEMMEERQYVRNKDSDQYHTLNRNIRKKCREAKEEWLNDQCAEIVRCKVESPSSLHKKIDTLVGRKTCVYSECIQARDGSLLIEKDEIMERWTEYTDELFLDEREDKPNIRKPIEDPTILKSEVRAAINKMKRNKAAGPDSICIEMIQALDEFEIDKVTELVNKRNL